MAEVNPPLYVTASGVYNGDAFAMLARDSVGEGVPTATDLLVTPGIGMKINVAPGVCYIEGDADVTRQPTYRCYNDDDLEFTLAPAHGSLDRWDIVVATVRDVAFGDVANEWEIYVITGTPAAVPVDPELPDNSLKLAAVRVRAGATTPEVVDTRPPANFDKWSAGEVFFFMGTPPWGFLPLDGTAVRRDKWHRLFAAWGTTYGEGDGVRTFGIPNMMDRFPVGAGDAYEVGDTGGAPSVALTHNTMPPHHHGGFTSTVPPHSHLIGQVVHWVGGYGPWGGYLFARPEYGFGQVIDANAHTSDELPHAHEIPTEGSGVAHENRPPYIAGIWAVRG